MAESFETKVKDKDKTLSEQDQEKMFNKMESERLYRRDESYMPLSSSKTPSYSPPSYSELNSRNWTVESNTEEWPTPSLSIYRNIPLKSLSFGARRELGVRLNPDGGTIHNWKSVADELGFDNNQIKYFDMNKDKIENVLQGYESSMPQATIGNLCQVLRKLDRNDILKEMDPIFRKEIERPRLSNESLLQSMAAHSIPSSSAMHLPPLTSHLPSGNPTPPHYVYKQQISSVAHPSESSQGSHTSSMMPQDLHHTNQASFNVPSVRSGTNTHVSHASHDACSSPLKLQENVVSSTVYDAFVYYDLADKDFVSEEFIPFIEKENQFKLFIPDRDLDLGSQQYSAQLEVMIHKCPKIVFILSDEFLRNPEKQWALNMVISLDPDARMGKVIPIIYKAITEKQNVLSCLTACDRTKVFEDSWFWNRIVNSLSRNSRTFVEK